LSGFGLSGFGLSGFGADRRVLRKKRCRVSARSGARNGPGAAWRARHGIGASFVLGISALVVTVRRFSVDCIGPSVALKRPVAAVVAAQSAGRASRSNRQ